jgi:hypothetical protein
MRRFAESSSYDFRGGAIRRRSHYSGLVSDVPEKAATIAGAITIPTKVRPIRRSCIEVSPCVTRYEPPGVIHTMIITQVTLFQNPTKY